VLGPANVGKKTFIRVLQLTNPCLTHESPCAEADHECMVELTDAKSGRQLLFHFEIETHNPRRGFDAAIFMFHD
jgi:hypothetical protein